MLKEQNYTTADQSTPTRSRQSSCQLSREYINMQRIIEANEQIIFQQSKRITQLSIELSKLTKQNKDLNRKMSILTQLSSNEKIEQTEKQMSQKLLDKVSELEKTLVLAKIESAAKEQEILSARHELKKIKTQNRKNSIMIDQQEHDKLSKSKIVHIIQSPTKFRFDLQISNDSNTHNQSETKQWQKLLDVTHSFKSLTFKRLKQKTKGLIKRFIPDDLRMRAWTTYINNQLGLNKDYYRQLVDKSETPEKVKFQIEKDIERLFPQNKILTSNQILLKNLKEILELFHSYRPDISYVQGMTYPATILLSVTMDKYTSFKCFCNLIVGNQFFRNLYSFDIQKVSLYCKVFDHLLEDLVPWLFYQLNDLNINTQMFLIQWFYTLFGRAFSYQTTLKLWDLLIYYGEVILYRTALAIFDLCQQDLRNQSYEVCINTIKNFGNKVKENKILEHVVVSKLTAEKLEVIMDKSLTKTESQFENDLL